VLLAAAALFVAGASLAARWTGDFHQLVRWFAGKSSEPSRAVAHYGAKGLPTPKRLETVSSARATTANSAPATPNVPASQVELETTALDSAPRSRVAAVRARAAAQESRSVASSREAGRDAGSRGALARAPLETRDTASGADADAQSASQRERAEVPAANSQADDAFETASSLFSSANRARRAGEDARAIELYRRLQRKFPTSAEAGVSLATLGALLLARNEASAALASYDEYLARGARVLDAEALVGRALSLQRLGRHQEEAAAWRLVLQRFPTTVYANQATARLSQLGAL
jgi:TolA-binding protein